MRHCSRCKQPEHQFDECFVIIDCHKARKLIIRQWIARTRRSAFRGGPWLHPSPSYGEGTINWRRCRARAWVNRRGDLWEDWGSRENDIEKPFLLAANILFASRENNSKHRFSRWIEDEIYCTGSYSNIFSNGTRLLSYTSPDSSLQKCLWDLKEGNHSCPPGHSNSDVFRLRSSQAQERKLRLFELIHESEYALGSLSSSEDESNDGDGGRGGSRKVKAHGFDDDEGDFCILGHFFWSCPLRIWGSLLEIFTIWQRLLTSLLPENDNASHQDEIEYCRRYLFL